MGKHDTEVEAPPRVIDKRGKNSRRLEQAHVALETGEGLVSPPELVEDDAPEIPEGILSDEETTEAPQEIQPTHMTGFLVLIGFNGQVTVTPDVESPDVHLARASTQMDWFSSCATLTKDIQAMETAGHVGQMLAKQAQQVMAQQRQAADAEEAKKLAAAFQRKQR